MPISFSCKFCGKRLKAPDSAAGKTSKCPQCGKPVTCPEPVYDAEPVAEQPDMPEILDDVDPYSDLDDGTPYGVSGPAEPDESAERRRPCPMCGEMILASAAKCRFCGEVFDDGLKKAGAKKKKKKKKSYSSEDSDLTATDWLLAIFCTNIACIASIIYMVQGKPKGTKLLGLSIVFQLIGIAIAIGVNMMSVNQRQQQQQPGFQPPPNFRPGPNMPQPPPGFPQPPPGFPPPQPGFPQPN
ncbi:MAG: hypothetical protein P4L84_23835 [Isosphaeraceae bacterium]|nr:hypothetical protein [Isosphaeraceae bacterium]